MCKGKQAATQAARDKKAKDYGIKPLRYLFRFLLLFS
jgi:hypothetical protein